MISRTSFGNVLKSMLSIMALIPTDLPDPVVPATSRCGIFARSTTIGNPLISLPRASVSWEVDSSYSRVFRISPRLMIERCSLGISRPIYDLPGITSTTRTLIADRARAMSFARLLTWLTFTPGPRSSSKRVITGPGLTATTSTSILKSSSFISTSLDMASSAEVE